MYYRTARHNQPVTGCGNQLQVDHAYNCFGGGGGGGGSKGKFRYGRIACTARLLCGGAPRRYVDFNSVTSLS